MVDHRAFFSKTIIGRYMVMNVLWWTTELFFSKTIFGRYMVMDTWLSQPFIAISGLIL